MEDFGYQKDDEQSKFSGSVKKVFLIGATLFSVACFIYITINAYYFVYQDKEGNVETVKSPEGPIKVVEDEQQNVVTDNTQIDRTIYEDIFGHKKNDAKLKEAKIRNAPEPAIPPKQKPLEADNKLVKEGSPMLTNDVKNPLPQKNEPAKSYATANDKMIVYSNGTAEAPSKDLLTKESGEKKNVAQPKVATNKKRAVRVQLAAMTSQTAAQEYWNNLNRLYGSLFSGLKPFTEEVNLGKRGLFYRLQIGDFFNQVEAEEFCGKYIAQAKKSRADCIVVE